MKGDFTRFSDEKKYDGVLIQQGRLLTDDDWNLQHRINTRQRQSQARDLLGPQGVPNSEDEFNNFKIKAIKDGNNSELLIAPGHIYVDGILCELESPPVLFQSQKEIDKNEIPQQAGDTLKIILTTPGINGQSWEVDQWVESLSVTAKKTPEGDKLADLNPWFGIIQSTALENNNLVTLTIKIVETKRQFSDKNPFSEEVKKIILDGELRLVPTVSRQPHFPTNDVGNKLEGNYYLDVWQRHITAIEDPSILESALNGPDTTTRLQTIWQIKRKESEPVEHTVFLTLHDGGNSQNSQDNSDNLLYRVEIHEGGQFGAASIKWSRDNGSIVAKICRPIESNRLIIDNSGLDKTRSFQKGDWVEVIDESCELLGEPGSLVRLSEVRDKVLIFDPATVDGDAINSTNYPLDNKPKVRRWDRNINTSQAVTLLIKEDTGPIEQSQIVDLENGIYVRLLAAPDAIFKTGDYWLIPFRRTAANAESQIEWPRQTIDEKLIPVPQPPQGIQHHYADLARVKKDGDGTFSVSEDLRNRFPSLINCLEEANLDVREELEVTGTLYVTGQGEGNNYLPARVAVGIDKSEKPEARVHVKSAAAKHAKGKVSSDDRSKITDITITPPGKFNALQKGDVIDVNRTERSIKSIQDGTIILDGTLDAQAGNDVTFTFQSPLLRLSDEHDDTKIIVTAKGKVGIGTTTLAPGTILGVNGQVAIGEPNFVARQGDFKNSPVDSDTNLLIQNKLQAGALQAGALTITQQDAPDTVVGSILPYIETGTNPKTYFAFQAQDNINFTFNQDVEVPKLTITKQGAPDTVVGSILPYVGTGTNPPTYFAFQAQDNINFTFNNNILATEREAGENFGKVPAQVGVGTKEPKARVHIQGARVQAKGISTIPENDSFLITNIETAPGESLKVLQKEDVLIIDDKTSNGVKVKVTSKDESGNVVQLRVKLLESNGSNITSGQITFSYQYPLLRISDEEGKTQVLVTPQGKVKVGTADDPSGPVPLEIDPSADDTSVLKINGKTLTAIIQKNLKGDSTNESSSSDFGSSRTLKKDIEVLSTEEATKLFQDLTPVQFRLKNDPTEKLRLGFIAEDVPDVAATADRKAINPNDIIAILTGVIKEQQKDISALKKDIATLAKIVKHHHTTIVSLSSQMEKFSNPG